MNRTVRPFCLGAQGIDEAHEQGYSRTPAPSAGMLTVAKSRRRADSGCSVRVTSGAIAALVAAMAARHSSSVAVPELSHILRRQERPTLRSYRRDVQHRIDERIVRLISAWCVDVLDGGRASGSGRAD